MLMLLRRRYAYADTPPLFEGAAADYADGALRLRFILPPPRHTLRLPLRLCCCRCQLRAMP